MKSNVLLLGCALLLSAVPSRADIIVLELSKATQDAVAPDVFNLTTSPHYDGTIRVHVWVPDHAQRRLNGVSVILIRDGERLLNVPVRIQDANNGKWCQIFGQTEILKHCQLDLLVEWGGADGPSAGTVYRVDVSSYLDKPDEEQD